MLASRLLFQSNFSGMSRSASLLGAHASAAARAGTSPTARYFDVFPCSYADAKTSSATTESQSTITNNGIKPGFLEFAKVVKRTFSSRASKSNSHNFTMGAEMAARQAQDAACEPFSVIEQAARYFNVFPCFHADAKTSLTTTGMPSTITNCLKPSFLNFTEGVKRTFSSSASISNNHKFTMEAAMAARQALDAACEPLSVIKQVSKDADTTKALMAFTCLGILYMSANDSTSTNNGSSSCSNCCNRQCQGSNHKAQQE